MMEPKNIRPDNSGTVCDSLPKCSRCNDTGKIKYLPAEFAMYRWQQYKERDCECKIK